MEQSILPFGIPGRYERKEITGLTRAVMYEKLYKVWKSFGTFSLRTCLLDWPCEFTVKYYPQELA